MASPPRTAQTGTFFVTTIPHQRRRRLFQVPQNAELFVATLQHYRAEGHYKLHAFVVMPDHVHLLLTPQQKTISHAMNLIEGGFSHRVASKFPVWQRGFADHLVRNADEFGSRRTYIHQNPVCAHLATAPELYPCSSAYREAHATVSVYRATSLPLHCSWHEEETMDSEIKNESTVSELREQYGAHLAQGYGNSDKVGQAFMFAGVAIIDE